MLHLTLQKCTLHSTCGSGWVYVYFGEPHEQLSGPSPTLHLVLRDSPWAWHSRSLAGFGEIGTGVLVLLVLVQLCVFFSVGRAWTTKTYKTSFWMRKYGALSFKRTWVWSSSKRIASLDQGPLSEAEKKGCVQTTSKYRDKAGKLRFQGDSNLKRSQ